MENNLNQTPVPAPQANNVTSAPPVTAPTQAPEAQKSKLKKFLIALAVLAIIGVAALAYFLGGTSLFKGSMFSLEELGRKALLDYSFEEIVDGERAMVSNADPNTILNGVLSGDVVLSREGYIRKALSFNQNAQSAEKGIVTIGELGEQGTENDLTGIGTDSFAVTAWVKMNVDDPGKRGILGQYNYDTNHGYSVFIENGQLGFQLKNLEKASNSSGLKNPSVGRKNLSRCLNNSTCVQKDRSATCISGSCVLRAGKNQQCDANDTEDCQTGLVCEAFLGRNLCVDKPGSSPVPANKKNENEEAANRPVAEREEESGDEIADDAPEEEAFSPAEGEDAVLSSITAKFGSGLNNGNWHHVAIVFQRKSNAALYIDGQFVGKERIADQQGSLTDIVPLVIGASGTSPSAAEGTPPSDYFVGSIDELKLFIYEENTADDAGDRPFDAADVFKLYEADVAEHESLLGKCLGNEDCASGEVCANEVCLPDGDADSAPDETDNCPALANPDQLDTDSDIKGDLCDNCLEVANDNQADADLDGMGDSCDKCPNVSEVDVPGCECEDNTGCNEGDGETCNLDTHTCSATDTDSDTIPDVRDNCPSDANTDQADADSDGVGNVCDKLTGSLQQAEGATQFEASENAETISIKENAESPRYEIALDKENVGAQIDISGASIQTPALGENENYIILNNLEGLKKTYKLKGNEGDGICYDDSADTSLAKLSPAEGATCMTCPAGELDAESAETQCRYQDGYLVVRYLSYSGVRVENDLDGDGLLNAVDNCPMLENADNQRDADEDNVGDACDVCPEDINPAHQAENLCDNDADNVPDAVDSCLDDNENQCASGENGKTCLFGGNSLDEACESNFCLEGLCAAPYTLKNNDACKFDRQCPMTSGCRERDPETGEGVCKSLTPQGAVCEYDNECQTNLSCRREAVGGSKLCLGVISDEHAQDNYCDSRPDCGEELKCNLTTRRCEVANRPVCSAGQELFNGQCMSVCPAGQARDAKTGICRISTCEVGQTIFNNQCIAACASGQSRNLTTGECELTCQFGFERVNGQCVQACADNQFRGADSTCSRTCPPGKVRFAGQCVLPCSLDNNEERNSVTGLCEKQSCRVGFELFANECIQACDNGKVRDLITGACRTGQCPLGQALNANNTCSPLAVTVTYTQPQPAANQPAGNVPAGDQGANQPAANQPAANQPASCSDNVISAATLLQTSLNRVNYQRITSALNLMARQNANCPASVFSYPALDTLPPIETERPAATEVTATKPELNCFPMAPSFNPENEEKMYISCLLSDDVDSFKIELITAEGAVSIADQGATKAGLLLKSWDGVLESDEIAPDGIYNYVATAVNAGGTTLANGNFSIESFREVAEEEEKASEEESEENSEEEVSSAEETDQGCSYYFSDIDQSDPECNAASFARESGYFFGSPSNTANQNILKLDQTFNRIEFTAVVNRMLNSPSLGYVSSVDGNLGFSDLNDIINNPAQAWIMREIKRAVASGVFQGYKDGTYQYNQPLKRAELWKTVLEAAPGFNITVNTNKTPWYADYENFVSSNGLGTGDGRNPITRREAIQFIYELHVKGLL